MLCTCVYLALAADSVTETSGYPLARAHCCCVHSIKFDCLQLHTVPHREQWLVTTDQSNKRTLVLVSNACYCRLILTKLQFPISHNKFHSSVQRRPEIHDEADRSFSQLLAKAPETVLLFPLFHSTQEDKIFVNFVSAGIPRM